MMIRDSQVNGIKYLLNLQYQYQGVALYVYIISYYVFTIFNMKLTEAKWSL